MFQRTVFAFAMFAMATTSTAFAETDAERQACIGDAQNHCGDEIPDRDRVYACLVQKVNLLTPACKKIISDSIVANKSRKK
jgi:hypothetical protein